VVHSDPFYHKSECISDLKQTETCLKIEYLLFTLLEPVARLDDTSASHFSISETITYKRISNGISLT
jgi:hypothetical protein